MHHNYFKRTKGNVPGSAVEHVKIFNLSVFQHFSIFVHFRCRQWYQEREKVLGMLPNSKNPSRPKFTAFMAFLTEMFCQMKVRLVIEEMF